jgi:hypothetical protein
MDTTPPFFGLGIIIAINAGDNVSKPGHVSALDTSWVLSAAYLVSPVLSDSIPYLKSK